MRDLLTFQERRRLQAVEILDAHDGWMLTSELANRLNCSLRILKDDLTFFRNHAPILTVESSNKGIQLTFQADKGLINIYQDILQSFPKFQLFEIIFFNESLSVNQLADLLNISSSNLYHVVGQIDTALTKNYNLQFQTNPCRLIGDEAIIRSFYAQYFYEKYSKINLPFKQYINVESLRQFLLFFVNLTEMEIDFAYFSTFELMTTVKLIRYQQGHLVDTSDIDINFDEIISDLTQYKEQFSNFEKNLQLEVNTETINQLFTPFVSRNFSTSYDRLLVKAAENDQTREEVVFLSQLINHLAEEFQLTLANKEGLIFGLHNSIFLEGIDIRSNYILSNENAHFVKDFATMFPQFFVSLEKAILELRDFFAMSKSSDGFNYLTYIMVTYWDDLLFQLYEKYQRITVLIISDGHESHANMIQNILTHEFSEQLNITINHNPNITIDFLNKADYDIIIANFSLAHLNFPNYIYIRNMPTISDIKKVQQKIITITARKKHQN